jgi:hypothetical protein
LKAVLKANPRLLDEFEQDAVRDFQSRIQREHGKSAEQADEAHQIMIEIAEELGLPADHAHATDDGAPAQNS